MNIEKARYENLEKNFYIFDGKYEIPILNGCDVFECPQLVGFNYAKSTPDKASKGVHFFVDDYQFMRLWNRPDDYINLLKQFQLVLTPDFSLYTDFPLQCRFTTTIASIGSVLIGRVTELRSFLQSVGVTKSHLNGALKENHIIRWWLYHLLERRTARIQSKHFY